MAAPKRAAHDHCEAANDRLAFCPARATHCVRGHFRGVAFVCSDHLTMADWGRVLWTAPELPEPIRRPRRASTRVAA